jgi:hypothetical protein
MLTYLTKSLTHRSPSLTRSRKRLPPERYFETMEPKMDLEKESLCRPPLNARNGDQCPVVCPSDLFVCRYFNFIHTTLELSGWPKRKPRLKSARHALQLMATKEELIERKILLKTRTSTLLTP